MFATGESELASTGSQRLLEARPCASCTRTAKIIVEHAQLGDGELDLRASFSSIAAASRSRMCDGVHAGV
jgi:hypothetical protein